MSVLRLPACGLVLLALLAPRQSRGCSIPVCRYALERWEASPYQALVFHRGPLPEASRVLLRKLEQHVPRANVAVKAVDLDTLKEDGLRQVWQRQGRQAGLPWLVLRPPEADDQAADTWAGLLTEANVAALLDSPARRRLVRRLEAGDCVVFLLLESGDKAADDGAASLVEKLVARLPQEIVLPEPQPDGPQLLSTLPLRAAFSLLRLSRESAAERPFVRMLLHSGEDLAEVRGPILLPIFGRGRSLGGLHDKDLNEDQVRRAALFLCGACSCQVKELNPGADLLLAADWGRLLDSAVSSRPPGAANLEPPDHKTDNREAISRRSNGKEAADPDESGFRKWLGIATVAAALLTLLSGAWAMRSRGGKSPPPSSQPGNA
jgi:hypothetical protein